MFCVGNPTHSLTSNLKFNEIADRRVGGDLALVDTRIRGLDPFYYQAPVLQMTNVFHKEPSVRAVSSQPDGQEQRVVLLSNPGYLETRERF